MEKNISKIEASDRQQPRDRLLVIEKLVEPCNCGSACKHFDGGNYHQIVTLLKYRDRFYILESDTRGFFPSDNHVLYIEWNGTLSIDRWHDDIPENKILSYVKSTDRIYTITLSEWVEYRKELHDKGFYHGDTSYF